MMQSVIMTARIKKTENVHCRKNYVMKSGILEGRQLSRATNNDKDGGVCGPLSSIL